MVRRNYDGKLQVGDAVSIPLVNWGKDYAKEIAGEDWEEATLDGKITSIFCRDGKWHGDVLHADGDKMFYSIEYLNNHAKDLEDIGASDQESNQNTDESEAEDLEEEENEENDPSSGGEVSDSEIEENESDSGDDVEEGEGDDLEVFEPIWEIDGEYLFKVGEFKARPGPAFRIQDRDAPILMFLTLFPLSLFDAMVDETNRYAGQKGTEGWTVVTRCELMTFVALMIAMCLNTRQNARSHWYEKDDGGAVPAGTFGKFMAYHRFRMIKSHLHFNDNDNFVPRGNDGYDPLFKLRPLLNHLQHNFSQSYRPGQNLTVDEAMIPYKGGRNPIRMYMPKKPHKWGAKVWCLNDSDTGYCLKFDVYVGKRIDDEG